MKFGLEVPTTGAWADVGVQVQVALEAEAMGWDGFFVGDALLDTGAGGGTRLLDRFNKLWRSRPLLSNWGCWLDLWRDIIPGSRLCVWPTSTRRLVVALSVSSD